LWLEESNVHGDALLEASATTIPVPSILYRVIIHVPVNVTPDCENGEIYIYTKVTEY
jgi:hypothetical protein